MAVIRKIYEVAVERDGKSWLIHVPGVERYTQARSLHEVDAMARDLIAIMKSLDPESFDLDVVVKVPASALAHLAESQRSRELATQANAAAASELRSAVRDLVDGAGFTVRDVGRLLGVSHQRVHQLAHEDAVAAGIKDRLLAATGQRPGAIDGVPVETRMTAEAPRLVAAG